MQAVNLPASRVVGGGGEETWSGGNDVMSPPCENDQEGTSLLAQRLGRMLVSWSRGFGARARVGEVVNQRA